MLSNPLGRNLELRPLSSPPAHTHPPFLLSQSSINPALIPSISWFCPRTAEFKKIPEESKLEGIKPLLKAYQTEIDQLTRRSKVSESAFLNAYKLLAEAPDPYPLLDAAVVSPIMPLLRLLGGGKQCWRAGGRAEGKGP